MFRVTKQTDSEQTLEVMLPLRFPEAYPVTAAGNLLGLTVAWSKENETARSVSVRECNLPENDDRRCTVVVPVPKGGLIHEVALGTGVNGGYPPVRKAN